MTITVGRSRLLEFAGLAVILVITIAIYKEAFRGFFVQDDFGWLESSRFNNLREYAECFFRFNPASSYRPLSQEGFFFAGQKIFGMWPPGFHLVSITLHLVGATLVYVLLRGFFSVIPCLVGTLFFAVHNAHLWAIFWISALPEPLALVFYLSAVLLFIRFDRKNSRWAYVFSLAAMGLGMMSKESILTLPLVLAAYCSFFSRRRIVWTAPFFLLSGLYFVLRATSSAVKAAPYPLTFGWEALQNLLAYLSWTAGFSETLLKLRLKWDLSESYPLLAAVFVMIVVLLISHSENKRVAVFSAVWFVVALQPVLYFSQHIFGYYLAPALPAVSLIIASAVPATISRWNPKHLILFSGIVFLSLWTSYASVTREGQWWNARTFLARDILSKMPAVDRQVPKDKVAYIIGFGPEEFGVLQNDAAFKAYGFSPERFIQVGLNEQSAREIKALKESGGINDYYCFYYSFTEFVNMTAEFRQDPRPFLEPRPQPPMELEVNTRELTRGKDSLTLKVYYFDGPAIDILYLIDGKPMPPITQWALSEDRTTTVPVSETTPKGLYHFKAIRDSRNPSLLAWVPVQVQVVVK